MGLVDTAYNKIFRRTSTFAFACVVGAFFFERSFDKGTKILFENINKGKLWKDIKDQYCQDE